MKDKMDYDHVDDVWHDAEGRTFIKNEFHPEKPLWIDISNRQWSVTYSGQIASINWDNFDIPDGMLIPIHDTVKIKLKKLSVAYMSKIKCVLARFEDIIDKSWRDFSDIPADEMVNIYNKLGQSYRSQFRALYTDLATHRLGGARPDIAYEMRSWKARKKVVLLREVLEWDEKKGALTSAEEKVLREIVSTPPSGFEPAKEHAARIYTWLLLDTLKRSSQVLEIPVNGLKEVESQGRAEWFVEIRPIKYQTGLPNRWWPISIELATEIREFCCRPEVVELHSRFNRLIAWEAPSLTERGVISAAEGKEAMRSYIYRRRAISPRTGKRLHVTPTRIRHTGATRLAFAGVSRDIIQEILEHDSPESCQAYIDAIGSEIVPQIEKAGRMMGNIFYELNKSFFGKVVSEVAAPLIVVPEYCKTPLIVGSCGRDPIKDGGCKKHPFLSCYAECNSFLAWNNPDPHEKALQYFEDEKERWTSPGDSGGNESVSIPARQSLALFDKAIGSAKELLTQIRGAAA